MFGTPARCYLTGFQDPCPLHMKLFYNQDSPEFGYCSCDFFNNDPSSPVEYYCMRKAKEWHSDTELRAYGFSSETESCYPLFSQGPCKSYEWFVLDPSGTKSICTKRSCRNSRDADKLIFYSSKTQSCVELHAQCPPDRNNGRSQTYGTYRYTFIKSSWIPQCIYREGERPFTAAPVPMGELRCSEGKLFSKLLKRCVTPFRKLSGNIG
ncbi:uncharacterized protein LOC118433830 [Folsomia candida]|nr:uncharacterized protein LOC118433830 [Folsomia candida]